MLSDVRLPHVDGVALIRAIKRMKPETAIVAAAGHGQHARNLELESLGVAPLLAKPYQTQELPATLQNALAAARVLNLAA